MKIKKLLIILVSFLVINNAVFAANTSDLTSAVGKWTTIDDKTGAALSVVQIYQNKDTGMLEGKIIKINPIQGQKPTDLCTECKGANKNEPILGMKIIWDMQNTKDANFWSGGQVLDPKTGNIYKANMTLLANGCQLRLRGYIMVTWLGRSQTWNRADASCASK